MPPAADGPSPGGPELCARVPEFNAHKRQRTTKTQPQEQVDNQLRKCIFRDTQLFRTSGWNATVKQRRGRGDFGDLAIQHPATRLLRYLGKHGAPVVLTTPPWDHLRTYAAATRGPHKSAYEYQDFLRNEMVEMIL